MTAPPQDDVWIVYRDVEGSPRKQFERLATPPTGAMLIKDQVFPGMHGYPDMHIKKHRVELAGQVVRLVTYTESAVTLQEATALAQQGLEATAPQDRS